ncbi:MAG: hypothetical protein Q8784_01865 [Vigna little leaf phytoplasma]|nr:hypothetical protein [Vigna little leaf phytoplasma]
MYDYWKPIERQQQIVYYKQNLKNRCNSFKEKNISRLEYNGTEINIDEILQNIEYNQNIEQLKQIYYILNKIHYNDLKK